MKRDEFSLLYLNIYIFCETYILTILIFLRVGCLFVGSKNCGEEIFEKYVSVFCVDAT